MRPAKREKSMSRSTSALALSTTRWRRSARVMPSPDRASATLERAGVQRQVEPDRRERDLQRGPRRSTRSQATVEHGDGSAARRSGAPARAAAPARPGRRCSARRRACPASTELLLDDVLDGLDRHVRGPERVRAHVALGQRGGRLGAAPERQDRLADRGLDLPGAPAGDLPGAADQPHAHARRRRRQARRSTSAFATS